jgi:anaerobic magnesium-protoporphyrin IX monomethyl ester cyclase
MPTALIQPSINGNATMIKVLLINPPQTFYDGSIGRTIYFPLGLMYLGAVVRDICHVEIFDCLTSELETREGKAVTYGASSEDIKKVITEKKPDIVGISVPFTSQYRNSERVAIIAKEVNPKIVTVFGGPDPSVRFKDILENDYCDYCVVGEGEETFFEFIKKFISHSTLEGIKGLSYKDKGTIRYDPRPFNTNLDALPFPAFDLVDMNLYLQNEALYKNRSKIYKNSISIITSRGCPYSCVFCSIKLHMGQKYRAHSPEYVMKLLRLSIKKYGIKQFHFEDDNVSFDKQRFETILDCIIKEKLQIQWDTPNGVRIDSLNYNILKKMKQSGLMQITLAIESGNQRVLDEVIKKKTKLEYIMQIVKYCKELKISANAFYVIGFPGEKISEMKDTTNLALKLYRDYDLAPHLMVATPLYGTELYEICTRDNLLKGNPTFEELSIATQTTGNPTISTSEFSLNDIRQIIDEFTNDFARERARNLRKHPRDLLKHPRVAIRLLRMRAVEHSGARERIK